MQSDRNLKQGGEVKMLTSSAWMDEDGVLHYQEEFFPMTQEVQTPSKTPQAIQSRGKSSGSQRPKKQRGPRQPDPDDAIRSRRQARRVICRQYVGKLEPQSLV